MTLIQIGIIATALISTLLILLQERGDGAGSIFGGGEGGAYQHRRGAEKFMFVATIIFVTAFAAFCMLNLAYPDRPTPTTNESSLAPIGIQATDSSGNPVDVQVTPTAPQQ